MTDWTTSQAIEDLNFVAVLRSLSRYIEGDGRDVKGLGGTLADVVATRDLLRTAGTSLGAAPQTDDAAALVEAIADSLQDAQKLVSKSGGVLGSVFELATPVIENWFGVVDHGAGAVHDKTSTLADRTARLEAAAADVVTLIETFFEPKLEKYVQEGRVLQASVTRLRDALDALSIATSPILARADDPTNARQAQSALPARLEKALSQLQGFADRFTHKERARLAEMAIAVPGHQDFAAIAAGHVTLDAVNQVIGTAADLVEDVCGVVRYLDAPVRIGSVIAKPTEPFLDAVSFVFNAVLTPVLGTLQRATGTQSLFAEVLDVFAGIASECTGIETFASDIARLDVDLIDLKDQIAAMVDILHGDDLETDLRAAGKDERQAPAEDELRPRVRQDLPVVAMDVLMGEEVERIIGDVQQAPILDEEHRDGDAHSDAVILAEALTQSPVGASGAETAVIRLDPNSVHSEESGTTFRCVDHDQSLDPGLAERTVFGIEQAEGDAGFVTPEKDNSANTVLGCTGANGTATGGCQDILSDGAVNGIGIRLYAALPPDVANPNLVVDGSRVGPLTSHTGVDLRDMSGPSGASQPHAQPSQFMNTEDVVGGDGAIGGPLQMGQGKVRSR